MIAESNIKINAEFKKIDDTIDKYWLTDPSTEYFEHDIKFLTKVKDTARALAYKEGVARSELTMAHLYISNIHNFNTASAVILAMSQLKSALSHYEAINDDLRIGLCHNLLGWIYFYSSNYHKRLKHNLLGVEYAKKAANENLLIVTLNNTADTYMSLAEFDKAAKCLDSADEITQKNPIGLIKKAKLNYLQKKYKEAKTFINQALELFSDEKLNERFICSAYFMLGDIAFKNKEYITAEKYLFKSIKLSTENNIIEKEIETHSLLAKVLSINGKHEKANKYYDKYFEIRKNINFDSLKNQLQEFEYEEKLIELNNAFADIEKEKNRLTGNNRNLENFAHVASHDMKEPLRMISSFSQLLKRSIADKIDESEKEYLGYITNSASRLNTLINDILDYSKLTQLPISFDKIDLNDLFKQLLIDFNLKVKDANVEIKVVDKLPTIYGLYSTITRLFQNLISNALKFTKPNIKAVIEISSSIKDENVLISVRDNGIGISTENKSVIFEMFARLHAKSDYEGSGIGLAACAHIVEMHKGEIWVESALDEGATFIVSLPLQQSP